MNSLMPILSAFAATDAPGERTKRTFGCTDFPSEEPSEKELDDWLNENGPVVRQTHGALLRGETPPSLVHLDFQDDLVANCQHCSSATSGPSTAQLRNAPA